ncbi:HAMP domain-containing sensor histidine kinase [Exiguobacterium sp. 17-1]|uniref:sensor histidine kinase n=1 Tax=Exiguobacterium TaxID=33986 RepID=UPI001FFF8C74|nr:HAMP domain-containing sensor histidine kinase [Exiguobacterium sp. 17-1]MCK2157377.1 HAMP domain-containing histidine kinase [Exiguobacterium sp. 17-1]
MNKLSFKITMFYFLGILMIFILSSAIVYNILEDQQVRSELESLQERGNSHRDVLSNNFERQTINHVVLMEEKAMTDVIILDEKNRVIDSSNDASNFLRSEWIQKKDGIVEGNWRNGDFLVTVSNTDNGGKVIMLEPTKYIRHIMGELKQQVIFSLLLLVFFLLVSVYFLSYMVIKPLLSMKKATIKLSRGEMVKIQEIERSDEVGDLARAITKLSVDLSHIQNTRKQFLTSITHELRTPITYIKGYAGLLKKEDSKYGEIIYEESERLQELIDDLFDLARMEDPYFQIEPQQTELNNFLKKISRRINSKFEDKQVKLVVQLNREPIYKSIDQARFNQVLLNLLDNALKYTEPGKRVFLRLDENHIEVVDEGTGVDETSLPYLFDRFYRVDSSRNRETGGTGLGLAITKEIVEAHNGSISAVNVENGLKVVIDLRRIPA